MTIDLDVLGVLAVEATRYLGSSALKADNYGLQVWGESLKGGDTQVLDVRGWGYLTGGGNGALGLSEDDGIAAQKAVQAYVVAAWNALPDLIAAARERDRLREAMPDLTAVIAWLQNGCDPVHAITELAIYQGRIDCARQALTQETQS